jgi:hypothetical protein
LNPSALECLLGLSGRLPELNLIPIRVIDPGEATVGLIRLGSTFTKTAQRAAFLAAGAKNADSLVEEAWPIRYVPDHGRIEISAAHFTPYESLALIGNPRRNHFKVKSRMSIRRGFSITRLEGSR